MVEIFHHRSTAKCIAYNPKYQEHTVPYNCGVKFIPGDDKVFDASSNLTNLQSPLIMCFGQECLCLGGDE